INKNFQTCSGDLFWFSTSAFDLETFCLSQLIPLFIFIGIGRTSAGLCTMCLALRNPDVSAFEWDLKPWNKLGPNDQYKVWYKILNKDF
uniref:Cytochrome c oxidase subunit NDUFA4 n=1 Tax=Podarcis muralis TaxID=64176 RepID=A0A670JMP1_PODMU